MLRVTFLTGALLLLSHQAGSLRKHLEEPGRGASQSQKSLSSALVSEAVQRLQRVFALGEPPHRALPRRKPPQFMVDLFNAVTTDADGIAKAPGLLQGNVVRSFQDKVHLDQSYFYFNISSVGKNEKILKAELRVFKLKQNSGSGKFSRHHFCRVDVYELLDSGAKPWRGNLIVSRLLPLHLQGWEVFHVTRTVSKWAQDSSSNHGFLIITTLPSRNSLKFNFMSFAKSQDKQDNKKSFLVLFTDDGRRGSSKNIHSSSAEKDHGMKMPSYEDPSFQLLNENNVPSVIEINKSRTIRDVPVYIHGPIMPCKRSPLYVDFEEIGWAGWIISPKGYNAYYCKGACLFPLGQGLGATNHATVQSIVHALKLSSDISTPCCVPNKLHSINLLYFDDEENVVLKKYDDMVAVSCGCH
ncbi:bone morphogenetic protein 2-like [Rhinatrema bivittatum]|uniref:bone morphogenetic protein 2-like n=1 Tax=Rhinatrema bivittatum TaxID=194408 RepID=UPI0011282D95|nr:bone morphogenetic protein 2-like [Rhinatrema bivittatum]